MWSEVANGRFEIMIRENGFGRMQLEMRWMGRVTMWMEYFIYFFMYLWLIDSFR